TMNVANIGNVAGLFDRISFDGAAAVTRDEACQLALNTLKATMVTYGGTSLVNGSTGSYTIQGTQATPKTSNNRDINANIGRKDWYGGNNKGSDYLTLEFGEEHFKDLRLEHDRYDPAHDEFGRPSNEWSYKKVTIGTFPLEADYTFTTQVAHIEDTDGTKEKALGLRNFDLVSDGGYSTWNGWGNDGRGGSTYGGTTTLWQNGEEIEDYFNNKKVANIADFTDNGTLVEVYVSYVDADWITDVVVIQTQMMEVDKIGSDYVSLSRVEPDAKDYPSETVADGKTANIGFNLSPIHVSVAQVKDTNEDCYNILKDLKSGDKVAVVPVTTDDGKTWDAAEVYVPETVSGALTRVDTYGIGKDTDDKRGAVEITVGGTSYKIADWNKDMWGINAAEIKSTRKDVTLLMDKYGNAMLIKDKGATSNFMVIGNYYQALVGNKVCTFVHGWDIGGEEVDLNLGSNVKIENHGNSKSVYGHVIGELVYYTSDGTTGDADYKLDHKENNQYKKAVFDVYTNVKKDMKTKVADGATDSYEIKASNVTIPLADKKGTAWQDGTYGNKYIEAGKLAEHPNYNDYNFNTYYYDKGVVFIYVSYGEDEEIESIEFKKGVQNVSNNELREQIMGWASQAAVKDDLVQAVVIKTDSSDATVNNMLYVTDTKGFKEVDKETNESFFEVEVAMFTADGKFLTEQHIMVNKDLQIGDFATYTKVAGTKYEDNYYRVKQFTRHNSQPAVLTTIGVEKVFSAAYDTTKVVKHLIRVNDAETVLGDALTAPIPSHEGSGATGSETYILGAYRGAGTDVFSDPNLAKGVINTAKAEWLNATGNKEFDDVDSAEDLLDLKNVDFSKVELDILLNEKPDSDGFRTAYLIVLKSVNADGSVVSGPWYYDVQTNGTMKGATMKIKFKVADWAAPNAGATVLVTPVIDGVAESSYAQTLNLTREGDYLVGSARFCSGVDLTKAKVEFTKGVETYSAVKVRYYKDSVADGNKLDIPNATATLTSASAGGPVTFTWKTTDSSGAKLTVNISNLVANVVGAQTNDGTAVGGPTDRTYRGSGLQALGTNYVDVVITGFAALTESYTVDIQSTGTNLTAALGIDTFFDAGKPGSLETADLDVEIVNPAGGSTLDTVNVGSNARVNFKLTMSTAPADLRVASYNVSLELTKADGSKVTLGPVELDDNTPNTDLGWNATSSATVTKVIITANENPSATAAESEVGGNTITVNFASKVLSTPATTDVAVYDESGASVTVTNVSKNGNSVIITVNGRVADGWTAIILASAVSLEPVPASFSLARISDSELVYVVVLEAAATGNKLTGEVAMKTFENAKPEEQPGQPGNPGGPSNPDRGGQTDAQKVTAAKDAIEALTLSFDKVKGTASTTDAIKTAVQTQIINAASAKGVTVTADNINVNITNDATDPSDASAAGSAGTASATVDLTLNEATGNATVSITINAPAYEAPSEG
ncbi:MAG: hypothetical protein HFG03_12560, partial [Oscillibacter sp.]|nr:hypothetical protein [Oscillibacter sp.]